MKFVNQFQSYFQQILQSIQQLPKEAKSFLSMCILLFVAWKLLYILVLIPNEVTDSWIYNAVQVNKLK